MATLYITEFALNMVGGWQLHQMSPLAEQTKAIGGASAQSNAFSGGTQIVRLHTDAICSVAFGPDPTAAATNMRMAANQTEYFLVNPGERLAVIANT